MAGDQPSALQRQTMTLVKKNYKILVERHMTSTLYAALMLPILMAVYLGIGQNLGGSREEYGIADRRPVMSLQDALGATEGGRDTVVFIDEGFSDGDIDEVIKDLTEEVEAAGKNATRLSDVTELGYACRSSFRGTSDCFGAVVFNASPDEGEGGKWNYTLRADAALGGTFEVEENDNGAQVYALPLQRAVDSAIARVSSSSDDAPSFEDIQEWPFTDLTDDERKDEQRRQYQKTFYDYMAVSVLLAFFGVNYHLPGSVATEREKGLSQLIDAMMPTQRPWESQLVRLVSAYLSFALIYCSGWIVSGVIAGAMIWKESLIIIPILFFFTGGMALTSLGLLGGTLFKKAQLSGVANSLAVILLGVLAQAIPDPPTAVVAILGALFSPCSFIFFIRYIAKFEGDGRPMNLLEGPPDSASNLPAVVLWIFLGVHIVIYPLLAVVVERIVHGAAEDPRKLLKGGHNSTSYGSYGMVPGENQQTPAVQVRGMTKIYRPSFVRRLFSFISPPRPATVAVNNLDLTAQKGQVLVLLGSNGSGKSTTLDAIAGLSTSNFDSGSVSIDMSGHGGIGIAPQKNVLWDELTVLEHLIYFTELKAPDTAPKGRPALTQYLLPLIEAVGLMPKKDAQVRTLSGGQKRKLQLGMMLTGGSSVCCVDEVSSGVDPLSRRKIWDILLAERGRRTIILTTHFLDEADLLADHIAILSRGSLQAEGSSVALKEGMGAGYRIHVLNARDVREPPYVQGVDCDVGSNTITYTAPSSALAAEVIRALEYYKIPYRMSSPTIEDVFLRAAKEAEAEDDAPSRSYDRPLSDASGQPVLDNSHDKPSLGLRSGRQIGFVKQAMVLVYKRFTLFKTNWIPYVVAFLLPVIAASVMQILINDEESVGCTPNEQSSAEGLAEYGKLFADASVPAGPSSEFDGSSFSDLFSDLIPASADPRNISLETRDSFSGLRDYVEDNRKSVWPGGWWLGDSDESPTVIYRADSGAMHSAIFAQNLLNTMRTNISIATSYSAFDTPVPPSTGNTLLLSIFFSIVLSIVPAFFGLYPNVEKRTSVRGLQYSSGVRSLPLWASHTIFDFGIFLVALVIAALVFIFTSDIWYHPGFLFPVFLLYGLASILMAYLFSLFMGSQLATFAAILAFNSVGFAIYLIGFLFILTLSADDLTDRNVLLGHYIISAFFPIGSVTRSLMVGLNAYATACSGSDLQSFPAHINAYGGPILYLAVQSAVYFSILLWADSGNKLPSFLTGGKKKKKTTEAVAADVRPQNPNEMDHEAAHELVEVGPGGDGAAGLRVKHVTKSFGNFTAVDNVSFDVHHGEVYALLGPNGAGKSTTISLIRGDISPDSGPAGGDVFIENISVRDQRALARSNLGVCPQFDALDSMTVLEHLRHYARLRGIGTRPRDIKDQVSAVVQAVGLERHVNTMAQHLSGGNKRKLSLGIALTGNPRVILLDEPSSGLDAAAKRIMWRTLSTLVPGRSILLTTHSMEEADALASRAGILAQRMLASAEADVLRKRFGDSLYVHLVSRTAPHSSAAEMGHMRAGVLHMFPDAVIEEETYHGQMRLSVPASSVMAARRHAMVRGGGAAGGEGSAIGQLILALEENKHALGVEHYSVSPTTLSDVFLSIVGQHDVQEEGYRPPGPKGPWYKNREVWKKLLWI